MLNKKEKAALISNISNLFLVSGKLIVGFLSGSISIISEAIHSFIDLIASLIAFISIRIASRPADEEHQYGHGKFEDISGFFEATLIFVAAIWIIYAAIHKIISPKPIDHLLLGIMVMFFSSAVNWFVSAYLYKVAREYDSIALEADALHLRTDVYTSLGVFVGLVLIKILNQPLFDPIIAIIVAVLIIITSIKLSVKSFNNLTDYTLSEEDLKKVSDIINEHYSEFVEFHELRGRKAGSERCIDLHLTMYKKTHLDKAHNLCDHLEIDIQKEFPKAKVIIHLEPSEKKKPL